MAVNYLAAECKNSIIPFWKGLLVILNMKYQSINIKFSYAKKLQTK